MSRAWLARASLAAVLAASAGAARAEEPSCKAAGQVQERLAGIGIRGELLLESGARARLDGVRWPDDPEAAGRARAWLEALRGRSLALTWRGERDRWDRRGADAVAAGDPAEPSSAEPSSAEPVDLAAGLVAAGLALVDAGEGDALCRPGLLVAEAAARAAGRGTWAAGPHRSDEVARLSAAAGRFVVAEGRVRSVGERRTLTYLNFAPPGVESLTVTLPRRTWRMLAQRGLDAAALRGRRVRARGVVELRRGPSLEVTAAEHLEVLDAAAPGNGRPGVGRARSVRDRSADRPGAAGPGTEDEPDGR